MGRHGSGTRVRGGLAGVLVAGFAIGGGSAAAPALAAGTEISFGAPQFFNTASGIPWNVRVADFNNDGKPDVATADGLQFGWGGISVLMNQTPDRAPAVRFTGPFQQAAGMGTLGLDVADFNGDGKPDVVAANAAHANAGGISVLVNHTADSADVPEFSQPQKFSAGLGPTQVVATDLNGDGKPDLVVGNVFNAFINSINVLMNTTEDGSPTVTFGAPYFFNGGFLAEGIDSADINGDGRLDVVVGETGSSTVSVLMNNTAPGSMVPDLQTNLRILPFANWVALADMNEDKKPDLLTLSTLGNPLFGLFVSANNTPTGSMAPQFQDLVTGSSTAGTGFLPESIAVADFDGDGKPDVAVANDLAIRGLPMGVSVHRNLTPRGASSFNFGPEQTFTVGWGANALDSADFNGDGKPDLVIEHCLSVGGVDAVAILLNATA